ncbi:Ig domain-containing protein [Streptomyces sp. BA2]|uniref:Ig domain-containing protein n=1 Tax=Streptomyces sp. BA2 TaxID=436595 RepID=UPI0030147AC2
MTVTNPGGQTSVAGTPVNLQIQASGSAPQTLTYSARGLPAGLSINSGTGLISGKPTTVGASTVTVAATDTAGATGSVTFTWAVVAPVCRVTYKQAQYHKPVLGYRFYLVMIDITNTGNAAIPGRWNLKFTFNEERGIVRNPNGYVVSPTTGRNMTVTEDKGVGISSNSTVNVSILTYYPTTPTSTPPAASFELNGKRCAS